uniref:Tyrosine-protein phosphatase non-receptor type 20 n=1 Tax=Ciona savignyi TaxID=51511 RepID=H2YHY3_CIOSA
MDNKKKNRYKNILPYDSTRVVLRKSAELSDYINANFIDGYSQLRKFIATQGPLTRTSEDFWRMVWEEESLIIVMLANVMEGGKAKCAKYWPEVGKSCSYGGLPFLFLNVTNLNYKLSKGQNRPYFTFYVQILRKIQHFQYIRWPDHGVPLITSSLIRMHNKVNAEYEDLVKDKAFPIIVHCSAGAGRTGAYIGFDILCDEMQSKNQVNVYRAVLNMRKQRMDMVQNMKQYVLLHKLLSECHALGNTGFTPSELNKRIAQHTMLMKEFDNLNLILPMTTTKKIALQHSNKPVNKDINILPYDHSAVFIAIHNKEEAAPYLNASFISEYMVNESTIVAQDPLPINVDVFWRAVVDNNVNIIVMLSQPGNGETQDTCLPYYPQENGIYKRYGEISVTQMEESTEQGYVQRKLQVVMITHLQCLFWKESLKPDDMRNLLNLIAVVGHLRTEQGSVLIHCCDGAGRSGVFCALNNLIQRLRAEDEIDVFRTVKDLRDMRPHMVRSFDNYMTCYKGLAEFRSSFDAYANI